MNAPDSSSRRIPERTQPSEFRGTGNRIWSAGVRRGKFGSVGPSDPARAETSLLKHHKSTAPSIRQLPGHLGSHPRHHIGRNHHVDYATWLAGGGIRGGQTYGATDDIGFSTVENQVHVHELHATIQHVLGLDHMKLTFCYQGRDLRLIEVAGEGVKKLLA